MGVERGAEREEVEQAFRRAMSGLRPELQPAAARTAKLQSALREAALLVTEAYTVLSSGRLRRMKICPYCQTPVLG